jgi:hypothetical protein
MSQLSAKMSALGTRVNRYGFRTIARAWFSVAFCLNEAALTLYSAACCDRRDGRTSVNRIVAAP